MTTVVQYQTTENDVIILHAITDGRITRAGRHRRDDAVKSHMGKNFIIVGCGAYGSMLNAFNFTDKYPVIPDSCIMELYAYLERMKDFLFKSIASLPCKIIVNCRLGIFTIDSSHILQDTAEYSASGSGSDKFEILQYGNSDKSMTDIFKEATAQDLASGGNVVTLELKLGKRNCKIDDATKRMLSKSVVLGSLGIEM